MILIKQKDKPMIILSQKKVEDIDFSETPELFLISNVTTVYEYDDPNALKQNENKKIHSFDLAVTDKKQFKIKEFLNYNQQKKLIEIMTEVFKGKNEKEFHSFQLEVAATSVDELLTEMGNILSVKKTLKISLNS
jgi:DNA modification methylase